MNPIKNIAIACLLLFAINVNGQNALNAYLEISAKNNPLLKAHFNEYLAALEQVPQVSSLPDPQVAFSYFLKPVETRVGPQQFKISANQLFPWFGTLQANENMAVQEAKVKYEVFEEAKSKLFNEVKATYYNLYFNHRAIAVTRDNLNILHTFQKLANIKVESGMVSALDQYRMEMEMGDLENQLAQLLDNQYVIQVMFNNLLNVPNDESIYVPDSLSQKEFHLSKQSVMDSILNNNHLMLSLSLKKEALSYRKAVARKAGLPNISVGVDYTFVGKGPNNLAGTDAFLFPKIGLTIPLYRNKYKAMANEILYLQESVEYQKEDKLNFLETLLEKGWRDYLDAGRRIELYHSQQHLADKSILLLETDYASGHRNFEEILRMERKLLKYNLELEKAKADKQAAIAFFYYLMGE